jgi:hypothetical protein
LVFFDGLGKYEKVDHVFYDAQVNDIIITNIKFIKFIVGLKVCIYNIDYLCQILKKLKIILYVIETY